MGSVHALAWVVVAALAGCGRIGFGDVPGALGGGDGGGDGAVNGADASAAQLNYVFATSTTMSGSLGGLAGADAICQARADAAGLPGTYVAFLSTQTTNARDRIASARGWIRPDGKPFADSPAALFAGQVFYPIRVDEHGDDLGNTEGTATYAYTGSTAAGVYDTSRGACSNWMGTTGGGAGGVTIAGTSAWAATVQMTCAGNYHLLCFGIDHATPLVPVRQGRIAFLSTDWISGGGLASADARCAQDALAAALPGTYHALLATSSASAASRFQLNGERWVRPDGIPVFDPPSTLGAGTPLPAPIDVLADGTYSTVQWVHTGAATTAAVGTAASTCNDWAAANGGSSSYAGIAFHSGTPSFYWATASCNYSPARVYCLQD